MKVNIETALRNKKSVVTGVIGLVILVVLITILTTGADQGEEVTEANLPTVTVTTAGEFTGQASISLIGTVRAFSEAAVTAEQAGRVTSVPVSLGQQVVAGQVIATLENGSEQAAVLQAEGGYEAALAAAAQNNVGTGEAQTQVQAAQNTAVTAIKTAFGTVNAVVRAQIDDFFADPNGSIPGLRLEGKGNTVFLNQERVSYQTLLNDWENRSRSVTVDSDLDGELVATAAFVERTILFVDAFVTVFDAQENPSRFTDESLQQFVAEFTTARTNLLNAQASLNSAQTQLEAAVDGVQRAELAASGGQNSAADAQVKQSLGSLRAAQANLAKTIIRTPIAGTVNQLTVRTGDFVGGQQQVAEVANNNALEIVTSIGEQERDAFAIGDSVTLEGGIQGTVTEIAPAVDSGTGKVEVRIASESPDLKNGDTITVTREANPTVDSRVFIPLSAVKFAQTDGVVFLVVDGVLEARSVTLGIVRGGRVEVTTGLTALESFVVDARGLQPGTAVEVIE